MTIMVLSSSSSSSSSACTTTSIIIHSVIRMILISSRWSIMHVIAGYTVCLLIRWLLLRLLLLIVVPRPIVTTIVAEGYLRHIGFLYKCHCILSDSSNFTCLCCAHDELTLSKSDITMWEKWVSAGLVAVMVDLRSCDTQNISTLYVFTCLAPYIQENWRSPIRY